jgi:hypothetical protein
MPVIDLRADLNAEDDDGRWWSLVSDATDPNAIRPGAVVIAGTERFWSVVRIEEVDDDGAGSLRRHRRDRPFRSRAPRTSPVAATCASTAAGGRRGSRRMEQGLVRTSSRWLQPDGLDQGDPGRYCTCRSLGERHRAPQPGLGQPCAATSSCCTKQPKQQQSTCSATCGNDLPLSLNGT